MTTTRKNEPHSSIAKPDDSDIDDITAPIDDPARPVPDRRYTDTHQERRKSTHVPQERKKKRG